MIFAAAHLGLSGFGHLHVPVFGVFATAGILAALSLARWTARDVSLEPDHSWYAGVVAVCSAFVVSRMLLIAMNLQRFRVQPMLVLLQPSLTYGGVLLSGALVCLWLRWKRLRVLHVLDAWAAPAALLAAILQLAHLAEGTAAGMPTRLPWGGHGSGDLLSARLHPVEVYAAFAEVALCLLLVARAHRRGRRAVPGEQAALALFFGGALSFLLSFLRQPYDLYGNSWLDPVQIVALAGLLVGALLWVRSHSHPALGLSSERPAGE